jgi:hypothetical protein
MLHAAATVRLAAAVTDPDCDCATALTWYVAGEAEAGTVLVIVTFADWPGASVTDDEENVVVQPCGSVEDRLKVRDPHVEESLFLKVRV